MQNSRAIIRAGRVGRALGRRVRELGWKIGAVVTRSEASARKAVRFIGAGKASAGMTRQILVSRMILIATPDDHIAVVAQELARIGEEELAVELFCTPAAHWALLCSVPCSGGARRSDQCIHYNLSAELPYHPWKARFLHWKGKRRRCEWLGGFPRALAGPPGPLPPTQRFFPHPPPAVPP